MSYVGISVVTLSLMSAQSSALATAFKLLTVADY